MFEGSGIPGAATKSAGVRVVVAFDWDALEPGVQVDLVSDGSGEPVESEAFQTWVRGAVHGIYFALSCVACMPCVVRLVELGVGVENATGMHVAAAAAFAVWEGLGVEAPPETLARIHGLVAESRRHSMEWLVPFAS